jgi:hypothetical protein
MGKQSSVQPCLPKRDKEHARTILSKRGSTSDTRKHSRKATTRGSGIKKLTIKGNPPHLHQKNTEGGHGTLKRRDYLGVYNPVQADHATVQFVG